MDIWLVRWEKDSMRYVTIGGALALGLAVLSASVTFVPVAAQEPTTRS
jgi:hypothetical protein